MSSHGKEVLSCRCREIIQSNRFHPQV